MDFLADEFLNDLKNNGEMIFKFNKEIHEKNF